VSPDARRFSIVAVAMLAAPPIEACGSETKGLVLSQPGGDDAGVDATTASQTDDASSGIGASDAPADGGNEGASVGGIDACGANGGRGDVIVLGGQPSFSGVHGSLNTGTQYGDYCPSNQAVIGYRGFLNSPDSGLIGNFGLPAIVIGAIQTVCATLSLGGPASDEILPGFSTPLRMLGNGRDSPWTQLCPPNEVVIGFVGRSGSALDQIAFVCGHWIAPSTCDSPAPDHGTLLPAAGGNGGGRFQPELCPVGQMAVGSYIRAGAWVDAFGITCAAPSRVSDGG
jgi:hypothetical protein